MVHYYSRQSRRIFCLFFKTKRLQSRTKNNTIFNRFFCLVFLSSQRKQKLTPTKSKETTNASIQKGERIVVIIINAYKEDDFTTTREGDGRAHVSSSKGERFGPRENAEQSGVVWRRRERFRGRFRVGFIIRHHFEEEKPLY